MYAIEIIRAMNEAQHKKYLRKRGAKIKKILEKTPTHLFKNLLIAEARLNPFMK